MRKFSLLVPLFLLALAPAAHAQTDSSGASKTSQQQYAATSVYDEDGNASPRIVIGASMDTSIIEAHPGETLAVALQRHGLLISAYRGENNELLDPNSVLLSQETLFIFKVEIATKSNTITLPSPEEQVTSGFLPLNTRIVLRPGIAGSALETTVRRRNLSRVSRINENASSSPVLSETETIHVLNAPTPTLVLVGSAAGTVDDVTPRLAYPIANAPVTSPYGMRVHPITHVYKLHDGTDFGASCGTPIGAATGGVVTFAGMKSGYGNQIDIDHGGGFSTSYSHMSAFSVKVGEAVDQGEIIGAVGETGLATGCHLHFMTLINGESTDPLPILQAANGGA